MKSKLSRSLVGAFSLLSWIAVGPTSALAQDAPPPDAQEETRLAAPTLTLDLALENREDIELTDEQAARLEAFRATSLERTVGARQVIAAWRDAVAVAREALADSAGLGPRERRRELGLAVRPTDEVWDALRTERDEREAVMEELRATLTVNQMSALWEVVRDEFPRLGRGAPMRGRGTGPECGPRFGPRSGPGFGPGFGPGEDPFGPRRFRR